MLTTTFAAKWIPDNTEQIKNEYSLGLVRELHHYCPTMSLV